MSNKLDFGTIVIVIYDEKEKPNSKEKTEIVKDLISILNSNIKSKNYEFEIEFEVMGIRDGCIYADLKIFLILSTIGAGIANYPNFKLGLTELWSDTVIKFNCLEKTSCSAKLHTNNLIESIHTVKQGDTLYKIASNWKPKHFNHNQFMAALYYENRHAFTDNNINKLIINSTIKYPRKEHFKNLSQDRAKQIVNKLMK